MTSDERQKVKELVKKHCAPSRRRYYWSSYALKGVFEKLAGCYIGNDEFKELMQEVGFKPTPDSGNEVNHNYRLEIKDSPDISIYFRGSGCEPYKFKGNW